ncbi:MAG TPA: CPBP family intramembrane glutamic endopeptidase [Luteimonas sp.]|nr:CPBP family intramembrane glutamic endopeptidase [Luteimonas sp.]
MNSFAVADKVPFKQDLKLAAVWGVAAGIAAAALIPYVAQLMPEKFARLPIPLPMVALAQGAQALALIGAMALLGLRMGHRVGLGSPLLHGWINLRRMPDWRALRPMQTIAMGAFAALLVIGASALLDPMLPKMLHPPAKLGVATSALNGLLASFYGGIAEELQLRLFLMTLLVWAFARLRKTAPPDGVYWAAIAVCALLFGAGHLPAAAHVWGLDGIVVFRTVALNAIAGLAFGWVYWKRGLEMAVLAHFSADIVLHVLAPLVHSGASA